MSAGVGPREDLRAIVAGEHDDGVVRDFEVVEFLEDRTDCVIQLCHAVSGRRGWVRLPAELQRRTLAAKNGLTGQLAPRGLKLCAANDESGNQRWLHRLRERGVIRVAASYAVIAWLLLQIADVTFAPLEVPSWVMASLIVAAVLGFPVAVALAWFYEAANTASRWTRRRGGPARHPRPASLRRCPHHRRAARGGRGVSRSPIESRRYRDGHQAIAVLPFQNLSTSKDGEVLAMGIAESVLHQLGNLAELDVISRTSSFTFGDRKADARRSASSWVRATCSRAACRATVRGCG